MENNDAVSHCSFIFIIVKKNKHRKIRTYLFTIKRCLYFVYAKIKENITLQKEKKIIITW